MKQSINGKVAIITDGSHGYGMGIAKIFKENGCTVWIIARDEANLKKTAENLNVNYIQGDISKPEDWDKILETVISKNKKIDILVNNAGAAIKSGNLNDFNDKDIENSINTNLLGHIIGCNKAIKHMIKQKSGIIINISSVCAENAWPGFAVYSAAKAGIVQFSKCLHTEVKQFGIKVTAVIPSWGDTDFVKAAGDKPFADNIKEKMMKPEEMGNFLLSICELPEHLTMPYVRIQPMIQDIIPM